MIEKDDERDGDGHELVPGAFYWALPVLCADYDDEDESWWNKEQPGLFRGWRDNGDQLWFWIGSEGDFPVRWIGKRIQP